MSRGGLIKKGVAATLGDRSTLIAFVLLVLFGGSNAVAVRFNNVELPPFWGAATRFGSAALIFWLIVLIRWISIPRGRASAAPCFMVF